MAVSGGADSMALALLANDWARTRRGSCLAVIVDHGLRETSGQEAELTAARLAERGVDSHVVAARGLARGPALAERARAARYGALESECARHGILHLLLGHHAADQAETIAMRMLRGSGPDGLAGMAALVETARVRLLRPLLTLAPVRLRATLRARGCAWVEDPSNRDMTTLRARLRALRRDPDGAGPVTAAAVRAAAARGRARRVDEDATAAWLGRHATLHPEGFALLDALPPAAAPLAALLRIVAGAARPPRAAAVAAWLARPRAATLGGAVLRPAGRRARAAAGTGAWMVCREAAAMASAVAAVPGAIWDGRVRLLPGGPELPAGSALAAAIRGGDRVAMLDRVRPAVYPPTSEAGLCWWPPAPLAGGGFVAPTAG